MCQREKYVIVRFGARAPPLQLCINCPNRAKERQGLIDQVASQVVQQTTGFLHCTALAPAALQLRPPSLETGLEARDAPQHPFVQEAAERQELTVPATVVVRNYRQPFLTRHLNHLSGF